MTKWHWSFAASLLLTAVVGLVLPLLLGSVSLRVGGIAFAMVTLAFAQAGQILVQQNPHKLTGGEEGLGVDYHQLPEGLVGVFNTKHLYWIALGYAAAVFAIVRWAVESSPGRVWQAIRENELRVEVIGLRPFVFKLMAFVLSSFLATAGGVVYLLLIGGATPEVTTANFTLTLLVMVVIGGTGTRWGALIGGALYTLLDHRLGSLAGSDAVDSLPSVLKTPLQEPLFVLGVLFILVVFFVPGGIARIDRLGRRPRTLQRLEEALHTTQEPA
jgi:branched-chain amino acid transport system permease protein